MSLSRRAKNWMRVLRVPFEWLGIGLGVLLFSWLPRRTMLGVCDVISRLMYRFDRAGRKLAHFNLSVVLSADEV